MQLRYRSELLQFNRFAQPGATLIVGSQRRASIDIWYSPIGIATVDSRGYRKLIPPPERFVQVVVLVERIAMPAKADVTCGPFAARLQAVRPCPQA
jgi:hypothetical protein